jgi:hypothetical protein
MKHAKAGEETIKTMLPRRPKKVMIDGQAHLSFEDVLYNLVLNNIKQVNYQEISKKVENLSTQQLSRKHRLRLEKQLKRKAGFTRERRTYKLGITKFK